MPESRNVISDEIRSRKNCLKPFTRFFLLQLETVLNQSGLNIDGLFLAFDRDGFVLEAYGPDEYTECFRRAGLYIGSVWNFEALGSNAVVSGNTLRKSGVSTGTENAFGFLQAYSVYFAPIDIAPLVIHHNASSFDAAKIGGIALCMNSTEPDPLLLLFVNSVSHTLAFNISFNMSLELAYNSNGYGVLAVDDSQIRGRTIVTNCNSSMLATLNNPAFRKTEDLLFEDIERIIDPLPANTFFWDIVKNHRDLSEEPITLVSGGKSVECTVSTDIYRHSSVNSSGIRLCFRKRDYESRRIGSKIGHSAIIREENILGESPLILDAKRQIRTLADLDSNVLLTGESGVGKDMFAQAIHNAGRRKSKPFITVNCGALPKELIASELFGYTPGAFTGASKNGNIGKFELANNGTIFLDEIGELPLDLQATLLRVVENKEFMRIGGTEKIRLNVKIISATNVNLMSSIQRKLFRADLYYRLSTLQLRIPPLRERGNDVILISEALVKTAAVNANLNYIPILSEDAKAYLLRCPWTGNVRELQNVIESTVQLSRAEVIDADLLSKHMLDRPDPLNIMPGITPDASGMYSPFSRASRKTGPEKSEIAAALKNNRNNRSKAAAELGISRATLYKYMGMYGL